LNEDIEDEKSSRKVDCGKINKINKMSMSALEHLVENKERQAGKALKTRVKWNQGFRHLGF
jgi:hypothetical protein